MGARLGRVFWIAFYSTANATVAALAPPFARARYVAMAGLCLSAAGVLAPLAGPAALEAFGAKVLWTGCLLLAGCAALWFLAWGRRHAPAASAAASAG